MHSPFRRSDARSPTVRSTLLEGPTAQAQKRNGGASRSYRQLPGRSEFNVVGPRIVAEHLSYINNLPDAETPFF
jgi:hypothetical protein